MTGSTGLGSGQRENGWTSGMEIAKKPFADLEDWFIYNHPADGLVVCGTVSGHSKIEDGHHVVSTSITKLTKDTAETRNTYYSLGKRLTGINSYWSNQFSQWKMSEQGAIFEEKLVDELMARSALTR